MTLLNHSVWNTLYIFWYIYETSFQIKFNYVLISVLTVRLEVIRRNVLAHRIIKTCMSSISSHIHSYIKRDTLISVQAYFVLWIVHLASSSECICMDFRNNLIICKTHPLQQHYALRFVFPNLIEFWLFMFDEPYL